VTIDGLSNEKVIAIKPSRPSPAVTVRQARSQALRREMLQIADYALWPAAGTVTSAGVQMARFCAS